MGLKTERGNRTTARDFAVAVLDELENPRADQHFIAAEASSPTLTYGRI